MRIAEVFDSIQGEGERVGYPSIFVRTQGCNFHCKFCDTSYAIEGKGKEYTVDGLIDLFENKGYLEYLKSGLYIITFTGGEPLLVRDELTLFLAKLHYKLDFERKFFEKVFVEVESNGSIQPNDEFDKYISQYNISPKMNNSGMKDKIRPEVLKWFNKKDNVIFKFVVGNKKDLDEVLDLVRDLQLNKKKIWLMPECKTKKEYHKKMREVIGYCKQWGLKFSPRIQIDAYGKKRGV